MWGYTFGACFLNRGLTAQALVNGAVAQLTELELCEKF
jgi:hypothetical protein